MGLYTRTNQVEKIEKKKKSTSLEKFQRTLSCNWYIIFLRTKFTWIRYLLVKTVQNDDQKISILKPFQGRNLMRRQSPCDVTQSQYEFSKTTHI